MSFIALKQKISDLGRGEYRYDRLCSDFSEHYLELISSPYRPVPDIKPLHDWLRHLNNQIRVQLVQAWKETAQLFGFQLGDLIELDSQKIYAVRMHSYPNDAHMYVVGFAVKKDGSQSAKSEQFKLTDKSTVTNLGKKLDAIFLETLYFEGSTRIESVKSFLKEELAKL